MAGRGTIEHSAPDFFRPIFLAFSTTIISEQWLNFFDGSSFSLTSKALSPQAQVWASVLRPRGGRRKGGPALSSGLSIVSQNNKRKSLFSVPGRLPKSVSGRLPRAMHVTASAIPRARPWRRPAEHPRGRAEPLRFVVYFTLES